jgi:hypothetical protein
MQRLLRLTTIRALAPLAVAAAVLVPAACAPKAAPLTGPQVTESLPVLELEGSRQMVFRWRFADPTIILQGEGVARVTAPDSARLDFFLDNGLGGGVALLLGDSIIAPNAAASVLRLLPPPELLWASLGRLSIPPVEDTVVTRRGDTIQADIGTDPVWRVTVGPDGLTRLARIRGNRLREYVNRSDNEVFYENAADRRVLRITIQRDERVAGFSNDIWQP